MRTADPHVHIESVACPDLAAVIEAGFPFDEQLVETVRGYCAPLREAEVDTVILGCTHFPLIAPMLQRTLGRGVTLVTSGPGVARSVERALAARGRLNPGRGEGSYRFRCTGPVETSTRSERAFCRCRSAKCCASSSGRGSRREHSGPRAQLRPGARGAPAGDDRAGLRADRHWVGADLDGGDARHLHSIGAGEHPRWLAGSGRGWVTAEYGMLPASTSDRKQRDVSKGRPDGRSVEIQRLIGRSLRGVIDFAALGERTVYVDCDVLQADGGTRCAAITGGMVALRLACRRLVDEGRLERTPLTGSVAAISCGMVGGVALLDLDYAEDSTAEVDANVVMTGEGGLVEVQATAERTPLSRAHLDDLLALAADGIDSLRALQDEASPAPAS